MAEKPTLKQIADRLNLSPATVSKALTGKLEVSDTTRAQVLSLAGEIGYGRHKKNRVTPGNRGELRAAVIIDDPEYPLDRNTFFYDVLAGFQRYAAKLRMETLILSVQDEWRQQPETYGEYLRSKKIDGVFISGLKTGDPFILCLESPDAPPAVVVDFTVNNPRAGRVEVDSIAGVRLAVDHLAGLGHKKIGLLNGHSQAEVSGRRLMGFAAALYMNGLVFDRKLVYEGDFSAECGGAAAEYFSRRRPTAVFCSSDLMAVGLIHGLQKKGLEIPGDISVAGFDNMSFCGICTPKLTTVAQDRDLLGINACALLCQLIQGGPITCCALSPSLVVRESTAKPGA
jgi:DNA-binding LacI/PurR family transcriptional regulator